MHVEPAAFRAPRNLNSETVKPKTVIRKYDKLWFRLLGMAHRWLVHRAQAHGRREKMRRFRRLLARQKPALN
jgi:hypothetical protein